MPTLRNYRHLTDDVLALHQQALLAFFPFIEYAEDPATGQVGWILSLAAHGVTSDRGYVYEILIPYPFEYPDVEPKAKVFPEPPDGTPHMYSGKLVCVHDTGFDQDRWTPVVGFAQVIAWIVAAEDWFVEGRNFQSMTAIPDDVKQRAEAIMQSCSQAGVYAGH